MYNNTEGLRPSKEFCDFDKEPGKLHFKSPVIYNGVCVLCVGWINLTKLDGTAKLEFNSEFAKVHFTSKITLFWARIDSFMFP